MAFVVASAAHALDSIVPNSGVKIRDFRRPISTTCNCGNRSHNTFDYCEIALDIDRAVAKNDPTPWAYPAVNFSSTVGIKDKEQQRQACEDP